MCEAVAENTARQKTIVQNLFIQHKIPKYKKTYRGVKPPLLSSFGAVFEKNMHHNGLKSYLQSDT
jgi:hypothetical protein